MSNQILKTAQSLNPGAIVSLFQLDARSVGGYVMPFVQSSEIGEAVSFGGMTYEAVDCQFDGLEVSGAGALPTPTISINNQDGMAQALVNTFGDMVGCKLVRIRTFACHLDGHEDADPDAYFGPDRFDMERKTSENKEFIEWELSAAIDQAGKMLPGRSVLRGTCLARYRTLGSDNNWNYGKAQCPYTGNDYFDENDQPTTKALDKPSRTVNCCKLRFGKNRPLPGWFFPGVGRAA